MATLKEFKEWLEQFPEDTIVQVAVQDKPSGWESWGQVRFRDFNIPTDSWGDGFEFQDFENNQFVKPGDTFFGKRFLQLGEIS